MKQKSFIQGAAILAAAGLLVKILGAAFKIPLGNWIGTVGIAYFTPAYNVYNFFLILATAGIPIAISKMVSERIAFGQYHNAHRVFKLSQSMMVTIGLVSFAVVFLLSDYFAQLFRLPESALAMKCIAPSLLFVPLMASYRGYFQGFQDMTPTALSQVVEQIFRVAVGLYLAYTMFHGTVSMSNFSMFSKEARGAAGGTIGAAAGACAGLVLILILYFFHKSKIKKKMAASNQKRRESGKTILKSIAVIAIPITIGASIMPIVNLIDVGVVTRRLLSIGYDDTTARMLYGELGFATSLVNFPQVLTQAISISLVPLVAAANRKKEFHYLRSNVMTGLRSTVLLSVPCALGLIALAEPILLLLYPKQQESAVSAAPCLIVLAVGVIFLAAVQTLTGILQGVGQQMIPVRNLFIGVIFKVIVTWVLTGIEGINVIGAAIGTSVAYFIAAVLNIIAVKKYTGIKYNLFSTMIKPLVCSVVMAALVLLSYRMFDVLLNGSNITVVLSILIGVIVYGVMVILTKAITKEELEKMPKGEKLVNLFGRFLK